MLMGNAQARAALRHMRRLEPNLQHRRRLAGLYDRLLTGRGWPRPPAPPHMEPVLVRYPVRVADKAAAIAEVQARRLELGTWFDCPLHQVRTNLEVYDYQAGSCPVAERACHEVVNLPLHPRTSEKTARRCVDLICRIGPAAAPKRGRR